MAIGLYPFLIIVTLIFLGILLITIQPRAGFFFIGQVNVPNACINHWALILHIQRNSGPIGNDRVLPPNIDHTQHSPHQSHP
jgi:hypothetical protein